MNHVDLALLTETEENKQFVINRWRASNPHVKYSNKRVLVNRYLDGIPTSSTIKIKEIHLFYNEFYKVHSERTQEQLLQK